MAIDPDPGWWRRAVFYQLYPRSFQDSNGDGIGDLPGIISRLDYLNDGRGDGLGVDAIWLSPTFPSPMKDFGYDVSDYCGVHPDFGTLGDMDRLIAECHERGIRVLLDFVPNHTSDQHPWFIESRSSRGSPKRDWYCWKDPAPGGGPPNNWLSVFGGSGWEWDEGTAQYYYHMFLKEQPDLNWRNPEVVAAMHDVLRFWMRRGIDGFRIDVMGGVMKDPLWRDNPPNPRYAPGMVAREQQIWKYNRNYPDVFEAVRGIRSVLDEFPGRVAVGEVFGPADLIARYYDGGRGLHLSFNFQFIEFDGERDFTPWDAETFAAIILAAEAALPEGALPCWAFGNHDRPRIRSRYDHDGRGLERARAAALLLLGMRGVPFIYQGDEIGMVDVAIPEDRLRDPARFHFFGRDPGRTPMQWDSSETRGFSPAEPWLPYGPAEISVAAQAEDPGSILWLYRRAISLRRERRALHSGRQRRVGARDGVLTLVREHPAEPPLLVAVNTTLEQRRIEGVSRCLLASDTETGIEGDALVLPPLAAAWLEPA
jgi:alpha-glucosidase